MAKWKLPSATAAIIDAHTPLQREILFDRTNNRPRVGDGSTAGGKALAFKSETDALDARVDALEVVIAPISSAMLPVVQATTLALARTAMGVPGLTVANAFYATQTFQRSGGNFQFLLDNDANTNQIGSFFSGSNTVWQLAPVVSSSTVANVSLTYDFTNKIWAIGNEARLNLGDNPDKTGTNSDVPGAIAFNVTRTSTVVATGSNGGNNYLAQLFLDVNPGSNQASTVDHRGIRVETSSRGSFNVQETIGGSLYNFHNGSGALAVAYGATNQFFNNGTGTVTDAIGGLNATWQNTVAGGKIVNAFGSYGVAASYRNTTEGMTLAVGAHGEASNRGTGSLGSGFGANFLVDNTAAGLIQDARALNLTLRTTAAGTMDVGYGIRLSTQNTGSSVVTSLYRLFVGTHTGTAPVTDNFGIYMQDTAPNYMAGQLRLGSNVSSVSESTLSVSQQSNTYAARFVRVDAGATGPIVHLFHDSSSPAVGDLLGALGWAGRDSAGNDQNYANVAAEIVDTTSGSEDGKLRFACFTAGSNAIQGYFQDGFVVGTPTGGNKGLGTINAVAVYDDNVLLTCYIRDMLPGEEMERTKLLAKWDARVPNRKIAEQFEYEMEDYEAVERQLVQVPGKPVQARAPGGKLLFDKQNRPIMRETWRDEYRDVAVVRRRKKLGVNGRPIKRVISEAREEICIHDPLRHFLKKVGTQYDPRFLSSYHKHWIDKRHLTAFPNEEKFDIDKGMPLGAWQQRVVETLELMHGHDWELKQRIDALEAVA